MMFESSISEYAGVYDYKVTIHDKVDMFLEEETKYIVTLSKKGVSIEPYYDKKGGLE